MANDLTSLGLSTLLGGAGTSVAAGEAAVAETLVSTEVSPFIAQPVDAFVSVPLLAPAKQDRDCFASLAVTMRSARRLNGHPGASGRLGETPASPRAIDLKNVKGWAEAACANYTGMDKTGRIRILNLALAHLCQTFNPENVTLGKSPTASNMKSALKAVLKESDIARPSDSDIDEYMEAFAEMVQLASQELGLIGVRESVKRTGPPKGKFKPETILRQAQAALSVLEESTALAVLFPKGETSDEAMKVATEVEGIAEILRTPGVAVLEEEQEIILEATEKVFEAAMVLNELYFRDLALDLDRTQADSILAEISSEADNLIAKNIASVAGISAETFKEVVRFYVEYWLASFRGNPPPVLTLSRKALDAAVFRVSKTVSDADRPVFEREARLVIYGLVTWERFKRPDEKTSSGRFQPTPIRHDEILRLMGEHSLWLEIFYEDLIRKKSLATANIFHQLVFKYIRYLYAMRRDRLNEQYLTDEGLEAEVVRLMLAQSDDKSLYSDDALHALREFFSTLSTKESPPLSDLKAVGRGVIEIASQTEKHFVPYKKGMGLGEWLETFPFDLSEKSQRDGFETTTGIRLQSVRKWGKVRDLKTLTDVVAHEPENHHVMLEVYYALDTLCQKHGMRVDIWDFMAAVFPAVGQMREAALLSPDGKTAEVVVRQPGVVENVAIHNQKYQRLAVGILKAGLPDRPSVIDQHASQGVQRPMWDTMEIIAAYISRHAGGGEEHQKQIYHYLILLRLIDVIPEVTEIRDLTDTVLSNHDRDIASCYQLRIIPEDEQFTYDAAEDEIAASARRWPVSDIKSGRFDRKLEILDGHLRALEFFGGDQKLTMPSGESVTVDALKAKLKDTFQQHNLFRSDLNTFDSPLKQEGSADYLKNLRKFYRELDVVFKQWLVMNRQPSVKAVGKISVQFMLVPKIGGITVGLMNGDTVFVAASDILELSEKEKWSEERTRAVFDVRLATAELKRQGNFSEENLRNIFETDVSEALSDYRRLELLSSSSKPTLDESHFIQVLLGREPRTVRSPKDYYVYVDEWRDDLRKAYRDLGLEAFIEEDLAACHQYFLKVRHPHRIYREDLLPLESVERLKHFFPFIGIQNETVAPLVVPKDKPSLEMLVEMALKEYIGSLPAAAELGAELPVIDMLLAEVVDFLLLENEHARGHRGQLIRGLKHAVAEHNKAHDRTSLERLKEKNPPLPLHGLLRKSLKADIVPKFFESGAYAVDEWLQRNFKKTHMIDAAALQRIATRYVSDRLLKILPHPLEDSILRETESLFGPYPKIRMMAVETYTILLNRYLHDLSGSLSEARTLILGEMADAATISVAKNRETFLKEVALRYYSHSDNAEAMYEEARAAEILAELLNQNVGETFDSEVERCWGMVVARTRTREEITEAEKREIEKIEREIGERRIEREIAWRVQVPALRAQVQAITLPDVLPTEPFVSEEVWRASREARDAYRDILKGTLKIMDAEDAALRLTQTALEKARADYDVWTIEFKETAISGELSQKEAAFEKLQSQANLLKIKIETDLQAISASRKADGQAVSLLAKAQAWVDLHTRCDTAEKDALASVEAYYKS
ncbi:MAG: hypothetical protein Q7T03_01565, partial [Deltaproteobacteria bacterium]|nr:hypothetical protein [Deltaproteobacteria bacterium]